MVKSCTEGIWVSNVAHMLKYLRQFVITKLQDDWEELFQDGGAREFSTLQHLKNNYGHTSVSKEVGLQFQDTYEFLETHRRQFVTTKLQVDWE